MVGFTCGMKSTLILAMFKVGKKGGAIAATVPSSFRAEPPRTKL